jgi:flagellar hook-length control protein FliK
MTAPVMPAAPAAVPTPGAAPADPASGQEFAAALDDAVAGSPGRGGRGEAAPAEAIPDEEAATPAPADAPPADGAVPPVTGMPPALWLLLHGATPTAPADATAPAAGTGDATVGAVSTPGLSVDAAPAVPGGAAVPGAVLPGADLPRAGVPGAVVPGAVVPGATVPAALPVEVSAIASGTTPAAAPVPGVPVAAASPAPADAAATPPGLPVVVVVPASAPASDDAARAPATGAVAGAVAAVPAESPAGSAAGDTGTGAGAEQDSPAAAAPAGPSPAAGGPAPVPAATAVQPAAAPADADAAPPVGTQVASHVAVLRTAPDGVHTMTVVLTPETLGQVEVQVTLQQGAVDLTLRGATEAGRAALLEALPELRRDLQSAGLTCTNASVDRGPGNGWATAHQQPGGDRSGQQQGRPDGRGGPWQRTADLDAGRPAPVSTTAASGLDVRV